MITVLVVDDERGIRELLADILTGYEVIEAENGAVALQKACQENPGIILLDMVMPGMGGFEVLRLLRQTPATSTTPVIMMSGFPSVEDKLAAWRLNARHFITKPCSVRRVILTVKVALNETITSPRVAKDVMSSRLRKPL